MPRLVGGKKRKGRTVLQSGLERNPSLTQSGVTGGKFIYTGACCGGLFGNREPSNKDTILPLGGGSKLHCRLIVS